MQYIHFMPILGQGVKIRLCILGLFKDQPILKLIQNLILYIIIILIIIINTEDKSSQIYFGLFI